MSGRARGPGAQVQTSLTLLHLTGIAMATGWEQISHFIFISRHENRPPNYKVQICLCKGTIWLYVYSGVLTCRCLHF